MRRSTGHIVAAAAFIAAAGCSSNATQDCRGTINSVTQSGNTLTAAGSYNDGQPVLVLSQNGTTIRTINASTTDNTNATFDITGVAKGAYAAAWQMTCELSAPISRRRPAFRPSRFSSRATRHLRGPMKASPRRALLALALLLAGCGGPTAHPARYLYVWAGGMHGRDPGLDLMTVIDANPSSATYGKVLTALTVDSGGMMPHHSEMVLPPQGPLFVNDYMADKSFLVDFSTPEQPKFGGQVASVPGGHTLHSFARLANGHVLATVQFGDTTVDGVPGGLAEFDAKGQLVRVGWSRDSAFPGAHIRPYGLTVVPAADRAVTTSSPMSGEQTADVVQVWRLSDLKLIKTLAAPALPGDSASVRPFEPRTLDDGTVLLNSFYCGFFRITGLDKEPRIDRVMALPFPENKGCAVSVIVGHYMVLPIARAHRYATIDIFDPAHPKEVASLQADSTFFPHWAASDPGSDRIVFTDQGNGRPLVKIAHLDRATGRLSWDERFKDADATEPGVSYNRATWPNGATGLAMPHAALFVP